MVSLKVLIVQKYTVQLSVPNKNKIQKCSFYKVTQITTIKNVLAYK